MKPGPFTYHAPTAKAEVLELLGDEDHDVRLIAGGQSLVPMMNFRLAAPEVLVDLGRVSELRALSHDGDTLSVAAGVRQSELLRDRDVATRWPLLAEGVRHIGHPQVRTRGTVCGSLAHHDPTAELPALAVALDARMTVDGPGGRRTVAAEDFFVSYYEVALEAGEMLTDVQFPPTPAGSGWSFHEVARRRGDFALAGVAVLMTPDDGGNVGDSRVVLLGVDARPFRARAVEEALSGQRVDESLLGEIGPLVAGAVHPNSDTHASGEYRAELAAELTTRAVAEAWERCSRV